MDPLLLEVLRFGTAILAGGLVAVIAQRIAFRHTQQLQRARDERTDAAIRRALVAEIRENLHRLNAVDWAGTPSVALPRTAWDQARALPLPAEAFDATVDAHAAASRAHQLVALVTAKAVNPGIVVDKAALAAAVAASLDRARAESAEARTRFNDALVALDAADEVSGGIGS